MCEGGGGKGRAAGLVVGAILRAVLLLALLLGLIELVLLAGHAATGIWKYWLCEELDLAERYGPGSWVLITGASSGMGAEFARKFAKRGFNLLLIGSARTASTVDDIRRRYRSVQTRTIVTDFGQAFDPGFFTPIEAAIADLDISVLVNNVAHRSGALVYHDMCEREMRATIACGTLVQARLTHLLLPRMLARRGRRSAVLFMAAQAMHPTFGPGLALSPQITLPGLSVYEAANAFGLYHAASVAEEYEDRLDMLTVTPGAVKTSNTSGFLADTMFAVDAGPFTDTVLRLLGNVQGTTAADPGHAFSMYLMCLAPWLKRPVLHKTGLDIARACALSDKRYTPPSAHRNKLHNLAS